MLEEININNLGIIKKAQLQFTPGLTVITGETGAGKTMVLSALHLLLGKRANTDMIAHNKNYLSVEGCWNTENQNIIKSIEETGAIVEEGQIFINRTVKTDGKSRSVIGGKTTPANKLLKIGQQLVNIHGQSDQIRLKSATEQRKALDQYSKNDITQELELYKKLYQKWQQEKANIEDIAKNATTRKREINTLKRFLKEYEQLSPQENEEQHLEEQILALSNIDEIRQKMSEGYKFINPEHEEMISASSQIENLIYSLRIIKEYDTEVKAISNKAEILNEEITSLTEQVEKYLDNLDTDALEQLYQLQERELEIRTFVKRYGNSLHEIMTQKIEDEKKLKELEKYNQPIDELEEELNKTYEKMITSASKITNIRKTNAEKMSKAVNQELTRLSMNGHKFVITIEPTTPSTHGADEVIFGLLSNGSKKPGVISKTASGGELSRIMLALEVVLADPENTGTFVFDEVDSGVGGETAIEIGKRLAQLANEAQVIVVTHLPQVAAYADNHLKVSKTINTDDIETQVTQLTNNQRENEITRMLSGMINSESGKAHAKDLLEHAKEFKQNL